MESFILFASLLTFVGFLIVPLSKRLGAPILLVILGIGMLVGEDGPGQIHFDNFPLAYALGSIALAIILFAGGLETRLKDLVGVRMPALLLATLGVLITSVVVGVGAYLLFDLSLTEGLLLGAVIGSTDAAATFLLIRQSSVRLPARLENTLLLESGLNDPVAIFLTLVLTQLVNASGLISAGSLAGFLPVLIMQLGFGFTAGLAGGWLLAKAVDHLKIPAGISPAMTIAGALVVFSGVALIGGSGFLAVYIAGLVFRSALKAPVERILNFNEALQWLSQIMLFLMLGLLVTPSSLLEDWPLALSAAALLIFVARPVAVFVTTSWFGFRLNELCFISWVGLRGAVPIFLSILPIITPGPVSVAFFNIVFVIVVASLVVQGWTIAPVARLLGVADKETEPSSQLEGQRISSSDAEIGKQNTDDSKHDQASHDAIENAEPKGR